ncbi:hypothetical protein [Corynebacterium pilosum]|uniref:Secreted protein n=1 Tax=Corynebacterium pilosum TaxID=35756 RepID=A0A376CRI6_9CORY|nr:hypothetical protein [Corynebacterium pilosum]STC70248.1 Uncharacterised protein [Corynebacterium pilosum]
MRKTVLAVIGVAGIGLAACSTPNRATAEELTIGIGWESVSDDSVDWGEVRERLDSSDTDGITVGVGRSDFIGFPAAGQEEYWAADVKAGEDRVRDVVDTLTADTDRTVTLTIDVMAPTIVDTNPDYVGVFADGSPSEDFPSATALREGEVGDRIEAMCGAVDERYSPDAIALTELIGDSFFSPTDEQLYREMTGEPGFPRHEDGEVNTADDTLNDWQSGIITDVIERCKGAADSQVVMDARVNWDAPGENRFDSGHRYDDILATGADLTLWAYTSLSDEEPETVEAIAQGLRGRFDESEQERITLSLGLWGDLTPKQLETALGATGDFHASVTPLSLMTDRHWAVLEN